MASTPMQCEFDMLALVLEFLGLTGILAIAAYVAVMVGVSYLGGKLFGSDIPEADTGETPNAQSRSWNPRSTQQEGIARPRAWGKNLHHGNIVAKWTDVDGDEREVLYIIVEHGDGPTEGIVTPIADNVFLNDQPAGNFGDSVDIQERVGTNNQTVMTGFEKTKLEYPLNNELILNEAITFTTPNDFFDDIEYTIMWPNGLRKYHKSGGMDYSASTVKVRIREHPSGGWTEIFNEAVTVRQVAPLFKLYKVNTLSPGYVERGKQYDLEFTNLTGSAERHVNDVYVRSVREVVDVAFTRPGKALVGIRAIATSKLSGQLDIKVIREDRLINVYDGSTWTIEYSRNRAWIVFDAFTQPVIDGDGESATPFVIHHYEGLDPSRLDITFFYNWAEFCSAQVPDGYDGTEDRLACDTILDFQTSVWKFTNEVAKVGRASLYWQGHLLTGWIDKTVSETTALVTMDNIMARSWANQWVETSELAGRAEVFFNDSRQGYERTPASLPNESAGRYTKIISIEGIGITTRGTAIHVANHVLKRNELIRNINNFRQYKDAFRYSLGDVLRIQHRTPDWGVSYRVVKSTANNKITLDRVCDAVADELLYLQSYDESLEKVRIDSYTVLSVSDKVVTIVETWDITPLKNYMVAIGVTGETKLRRIIKIDSIADNYFDITVETYDTSLFDADDLDPDNPNQNYTWGTPANPLVRPVTRDEVIDLINTLAAPQPDIDAPQTSNLTWSGSGGDTVTWSKTDATEAIVFRYKGTDYEITADSTTDEFIYWDPAYTTTFRTTNDASVAVTLGKWYMCRNVDGVAWPTIPFSSIHAGIIQAGTIRAEQYLELRNTFVYNGDDSLDNSKPFTIPFKIVSEMTAIVSIKLSFRIMPYRAYSTAASSGGGATSGDGGGAGGGSGGGQTTSAGGVGYPETTDSAEANGSNTDYEDGADLYTTYESNGSHRHGVTGRNHRHSLDFSFTGHTHGVDFPDHTHTVSNHTHTGPVHSHSTPNHTHGVTYGIHEESNSPTVHFHIDNGAGFGGASGDYNSDQLDIDISGSLSGTGWKNLRFDTNLRCRVFVIIELKLDITA